MNPFHCIGLVVLYLLTVFVLTRISKRRTEPLFNSKYLAMFHNLFCTLLSLYMCLEIWRQAYIGGYHIFRESMDRTPAGLPMASVLWVFYASKVPEFLDTILMAIKPNCRQITFLHVYHHSSIFLIWWIIMSYAPGGASYFSAALNSFVHVVMYGTFGRGATVAAVAPRRVAARAPGLQNFHQFISLAFVLSVAGYYFWSSVAPKQPEGTRPRWNQPAFYRQYITQFQLLQFCLNFIQATYLLFINPATDFPMFTIWILFYYMITMLGLFGNFFVKQYMQKGSKRSAKINVAGEGKETKKGQ
jgi:hypothetical protein